MHREKDSGNASGVEVAKYRAQRLWERMTFEVNLLTSRMSWLFVSQSFLFAAFFLGAMRLDSSLEYAMFLVLGVPAIGLVMCILISIYVRTANLILADCRAELSNLKKEFPVWLRDEVDGNQRLEREREYAQIATNLSLMLFVVFWLVAIGIVIANWNRFL